MHKNTLTRLAPPVIVAMTMALVWVYISRDMYLYNTGFRAIFGLNIFPLLGWIIALPLSFFLMEYILRKTNLRQPAMRVALILATYVSLVIIGESVGYHLLGIHNVGTGQYAGLPLCDCLHAPWWMQTVYFSMGPIHWLIVTQVAYNKPAQLND